MALIIFCIQVSPVMRTSGFTMANRPQNVKNTDASIPLAAAVVARIVVGQIRSRSPPQAMIVSLFFFLTDPRCTASSASMRPSRSAKEVGSATRCSIVATRSRLPDEVAILAGLDLGGFEQIVARDRGPARDVGFRARIGGEELESVPRVRVFQRASERYERPGAGLASSVDGGDDVHRWTLQMVGGARSAGVVRTPGVALRSAGRADAIGDHRPHEADLTRTDHRSLPVRPVAPATS